MTRQLVEMWALGRHYRFVPYQYVRHGLFLESSKDDIYQYLPPALFNRYLEVLNPREHWYKAEDKRAFAATMAGAGLPTIPELFTIRRDGAIHGPDDQPVAFHDALAELRAAGHDSVILKPRRGGEGAGIRRATVSAVGLDVAGRTHQLSELCELLFGRTPHQIYLVQPYLRQHPMLDAINPASVNTVRIDTLVVDGEVLNNGAVLRMSDGTEVRDNWARGGYIAAIDLASGALGRTAHRRPKYGRQTVESHPHTGFRFGGAVLPHWEAVKDVVRRAASVFLPMRAIGWDVAIAEHGPVLVEANQTYSIYLQQEGAGGLRNRPIGRELEAHYSWPSLPPRDV